MDVVMHIYNIKQSLKEKFYGVPKINGGTPDNDARALASMASYIMTMVANDGHRYWYLFMNDIKDRDVIRFLMRRNGLTPEFHQSNYFMDSRPVFRVRLCQILSCPNQQQFVRRIDDCHNNLLDVSTETLRYIDKIKTELFRLQNQK